MRVLALIAALAFAAPAAAQDYYPRMRCASCSLLPAGATGSDLTLTGTSTAVKFSSTAGSGSNGFENTVNGARVDFGAGANDYASSDGTAVTFAGGVNVPAGQRLGYEGNTQGFVSDGVTVTSGRPVASTNFFNTSSTGTPASGTGITANYTSAVRHFVHKVTVTNAAMAAAATTTITLHATPVNTRIIRVLDEVTQVFTGGALSAVTVVCGSTAGGNEYLLSHSVLSATGAFGDVVAEMGAGVVSSTLADFGTVATGVPGAITVQCRFTCTGANCNAATQGSATFYVEGVTY